MAIALRFSFLSLIPPSASLDEATIGWNAYSILHTGRDEYGYFLPILLRAYDDYRPALYVYTVIPFVKIFGLQVLSVRLPSVIMSIATVIMTYFLTKNLLVTHKKKEYIALLAMFLLAISPWHIYLSRLGHEVNLGLTLVVVALLLFTSFLRSKNPWTLMGSFLFFGLTFYGYQSEKVFTPCILFVLIILFWKNILEVKKHALVGFALFILISIPMVVVSLSPGGLIRLKGTSVFTDNPRYAQSAKDILYAKQHNNYIGEILNNRRVITGEIFIQNYLSHFSLPWLFGNSGDEQFKAPNTGLLYVWEAPFLFIGIFLLFLSKSINKKVTVLLLAWTGIDFLAPGLTTQAPHAMRAYTLLPVPQIITALGINMSLSFLQKHSRPVYFGFVLLFSVVVLSGLYQFIVNYFVVFPIRQSESFQYALSKAMTYVVKEKNAYQYVDITNRNNGYQSYMLYLFNSMYDPARYIKNGGTKSGGFQETHVIDTIYFHMIGPNPTKKDTLYVTNTKRKNTIIKEVFYSLDGQPSLYAWTIRE